MGVLPFHSIHAFFSYNLEKKSWLRVGTVDNSIAIPRRYNHGKGFYDLLSCSYNKQDK